jgi:tetratricopeptide (TPR) repeat protein
MLLAHALRASANLSTLCGDDTAARAFRQQAVAAYRVIEATFGPVEAFSELGDAYCALGDYAEAQAHFERHLSRFRAEGNLLNVAWCLLGLGDVALGRGNEAQARVHYRHSLRVLWNGEDQSSAAANAGKTSRIGTKSDIANVLERLARATEASRACRLLGAAEAMRQSCGTPMAPVRRMEQARRTATLRSALGEEAFAAAWEEGRAQPLDEVIALALQDANGTPQAHGSKRPTP